MLSRHTLSPNVQMFRPLEPLDKEHLTSSDLEFQRSGLPVILILDLRSTQSMDSDGLAWLVNLQILMSEYGKTLLLVNPSTPVRSMLRKAGVENHFLTAPSLKLIQEILIPLHPELFSTSIVPGH